MIKGFSRRFIEDKLQLIKEAHEYLEGYYPKNFDCGTLCGKACCKGEGEIWLLPYERYLYEDNGFGNSHGGIFHVKTYENDDGTSTDVLVCDGSCDGFRQDRPFWCRIFPCFPIVTAEYDEETEAEYISIRTRRDVRGGMCPMVRGEEDIREDFAERVMEVIDLLCADDEMFEYFLKCGEFYTELEELYRKFEGNE